MPSSSLGDRGVFSKEGKLTVGKVTEPVTGKVMNTVDSRMLLNGGEKMSRQDARSKRVKGCVRSCSTLYFV